MSFVSRCDIIQLVTMCSKILLHTQISEISLSFSGLSLSPFLKVGLIWAVIQSVGTMCE